MQTLPIVIDLDVLTVTEDYCEPRRKLLFGSKTDDLLRASKVPTLLLR